MDGSSNWFIKSADKWWVALVVYTILIVASCAALLLEWPNALAIGIYALAGAFFLYSMCIQGVRKRWGKLALGLGLGFLVTIVGVFMLFALAMLDGMNPHPEAVNKAFHSNQFVKSTHMAFPSSASFIAQDDTIIVRGGEGEYTATAFVKLGKQDFNKVLAKLKADSSFQANNGGEPAEAKYQKQNPLLTAFKPNQSFSHDDPGRSIYTVGFDEKHQIIMFKISTY
jgi:hypothetical protein